jgi:hypothetical protein
MCWQVSEIYVRSEYGINKSREYSQSKLTQAGRKNEKGYPNCNKYSGNGDYRQNTEFIINKELLILDPLGRHLDIEADIARIEDIQGGDRQIGF